MRCLSVVVGSLLALGIGGCKHSDVSINLPRSVIQFGPAEQLQPPGTFAVAASPDGKLLACAGPGENEKFYIRTWAGTLIRHLPFSVNDSQPVLFSQDDKTLYVAAKEGIMAVDVDSGAQHLLASWSNGGGFIGWNPQHTIAAFDRGFLTSTGRSVSAGAGTVAKGFDSDGNLWAQADNAWWVLSPDGKYGTSSGTAPRLVEGDRDKGAMHLVDKQIDSELGKGHAYITAVWLTHDNAVPQTNDDRATFGDSYYRAALVGAYQDVIAYGFVPGHDAIYVLSGSGMMFVPYKEIRKAAAEQP